tara:strand:- start:429 stop:1319 length:891 start_codon:yes stop_codon:yes gene_type:complete
MKRKILKIALLVFVLFTGFSFYMSPSLGGLIKGGKDEPDKTVEKLEFENTRNQDFQIKYQTFVENPDLTKLRTDFKLDTLIQNATSDFEKVLKIQSWVNSRWEHDGNNTPEKSDAYFILKQAEKGERFRCVEYSIVASECLKSLGFKVRNVGLMTRDIEEVNYGGGHAVNEVYIPDLNKWIFIDPQYDVIATENGVPLNAVELQEVIANKKPFEIINPNKVIGKEEYIDWIGPYLYYFYVSLNKGKVSILDRIIGSKKQLTLVPIGGKEPKYFQRIFRLNNTYFTNSTADFYQTEK